MLIRINQDKPGSLLETHIWVVVGYNSNRLDEPVFLAGPKIMQTEFDIHHRLMSCDLYFTLILQIKIADR